MPENDEVDRIVAAWQRAHPGLDFSPLQVLSRVARLSKHLDRARRDAFASSGLEPWEFDVLAALRREGPPFHASPKALLQQTLVSSGTMTNRIDRLVEHALVERLPSPDDRRGVLVQLTAEGLARVDSALADLLESERALLRHLDRADRVRLEQALDGSSDDLLDSAPSAALARRLLYRLGSARVRDAVLLRWAAAPRNAIAWRMLLQMAEGWRQPRFALSGHDVMAAGVAAGPRVGQILALVEDWWIDTDFTADQGALRDRMAALLKDGNA